MKPKLILDTDIGTDVDDAYALLLALGCPEVDLAAVTLVHAKLDIRAKIVLKMLKLANRLDVPVAAGLSKTLTRRGKQYWNGHEGTETDFSDIAGLKAETDGVDRILRLVRENPGEVVIAPVGPLTNIAAAIKQDPETMRQVRRIVTMASVFRGTGPSRANGEHNARVDTDATAIVLQSGLPITLVGLNVTMQVVLTQKQIESLRGVSPVCDYAAQMGDQFLRIIGNRATWMHDPLAVAIAARPEIATTIPMKTSVPSGKAALDGQVVFEPAEPGEPAVDVCVDIDIPAFEAMFFSRMRQVVKGAA